MLNGVAVLVLAAVGQCALVEIDGFPGISSKPSGDIDHGFDRLPPDRLDLDGQKGWRQLRKGIQPDGLLDRLESRHASANDVLAAGHTAETVQPLDTRVGADDSSVRRFQAKHTLA